MKQILCILAAAAALASGQTVLPKEPGQAKGRGFGNTNSMNIELSVYVLSGLSQPQPGAKEEIPQDLASLVTQLRGVFMYKIYKLIDEFQLRGRNMGGAEVGGELPYFNGGQYDFKYRAARVTPNTRMVHIDALRLEITRRPPGPIAATASAAPITVALVQTDLDVTEGQKTVVGKSAVNGSDALFLVVVPKIIE